MNYVGGYHLVPSTIQPRDVTCSILTPVEAVDVALYQELVIFSFAIVEGLVKSSIASIKISLYSSPCILFVFSTRSVPLTVIKFLIIFMFVEFLIKQFFQSCSVRTGQDPHRCMIHLLLSVMQTIFLIRSFYVRSQFIASTSNTIFWWALQTQTEWVIFEPARTHHLGPKAQNSENPVFTFWCFSLKAVHSFCKLERILKLQSFWLCIPLLTLT